MAQVSIPRLRSLVRQPALSFPNGRSTQASNGLIFGYFFCDSIHKSYCNCAFEIKSGDSARASPSLILRSIVTAVRPLRMHKMEADDLRRLHRLVEVTVNGVLDHGAQLLQSVPLGMDALGRGGSRIAAARLVLTHLKDDLAHRKLTLPVWINATPPE